MARRWKTHFLTWLIVLVLIGTGVVLYVPALHWGLIGLVRRDRFFHGRPTSYWRFALNDQFSGNPDHELAQGGKEAVPVLIELLNGEGRTVRRRAAKVLGWIGPPARAAIPALQEAMEEEDFVLCINASQALKRIAPEEDQE